MRPLVNRGEMPEVRDLGKGLWIWRARHYGWTADADWQPVVTSTFVQSGGERLVIDPIVPTPEPIEVWQRLEKVPPTAVAITMPDHVRDVSIFARRFRAKAFGPMFFFPDDLPSVKLESVVPGSKLPCGAVALYDARGRLETPFWLPEQKVIVFGDALTERSGELHVWNSPWHRTRELPALQAMLELPVEKVIISHADVDPVHTRSDFERALSLPPWEG